MYFIYSTFYSINQDVFYIFYKIFTSLFLDFFSFYIVKADNAHFSASSALYFLVTIII